MEKTREKGGGDEYHLKGLQHGSMDEPNSSLLVSKYINSVEMYKFSFMLFIFCTFGQAVGLVYVYNVVFCT